MKYRAFTLIEVLISIVLFSIIVLFLYQTLDMTTKSNIFYEKKLQEQLDINRFKKILFLDLINKQNKIVISRDKEDNSVVSFKSSYIYHNPFYTYITYIVVKNGDFLRIESKYKFNIKKLDDKFFDTSYIDVIQQGIKKFLFSKQQNGKLTLYILKDRNKKIIFGF